MLTHIVCWKYRPDVTEEDRAKHVDMLLSLPGLISEIESLSVGRDILHLDRSFYTGLVSTFADKAALDRYTEHPEHQKVIEFGRSITQQAVSVDFTE